MRDDDGLGMFKRKRTLVHQPSLSPEKTRPRKQASLSPPSDRISDSDEDTHAPDWSVIHSIIHPNKSPARPPKSPLHSATPLPDNHFDYVPRRRPIAKNPPVVPTSSASNKPPASSRKSTPPRPKSPKITLAELDFNPAPLDFTVEPLQPYLQNEPEKLPSLSPELPPVEQFSSSTFVSQSAKPSKKSQSHLASTSSVTKTSSSPKPKPSNLPSRAKSGFTFHSATSAPAASTTTVKPPVASTSTAKPPVVIRPAKPIPAAHQPADDYDWGFDQPAEDIGDRRVKNAGDDIEMSEEEQSSGYVSVEQSKKNGRMTAMAQLALKRREKSGQPESAQASASRTEKSKSRTPQLEERLVCHYCSRTFPASTYAAHIQEEEEAFGDDIGFDDDEEEEEEEPVPPPRPAHKPVAAQTAPKVRDKGKGKAKEVIELDETDEDQDYEDDGADESLSPLKWTSIASLPAAVQEGYKQQFQNENAEQDDHWSPPKATITASRGRGGGKSFRGRGRGFKRGRFRKK